PFFAGVGIDVLQELASALTLQHVAPGEVVLHVGELTDRLYVLLSGSCWVVRHSRREGFEPQPPQQLMPGQALCEAALVVSGRRADVEVTVEAAVAAAVPVGGHRGGASFAVLTRAAWSNLCIRAPVQRTLEQSEDLAALLRLVLPGLCSASSGPVLRAMSESAFLRHLPPGTIMFEEATRAEAQFLVLAGGVEIRRRQHQQQSLGGSGPGAARKAGRRAATATEATAAAAAVASSTSKSVRQKIEDERKAREALKESLALTRDGLRETLLPPPPPPPPPCKSVSSSGRWISEFVDRATRKMGPHARGGGGTDQSATAIEESFAMEAVARLPRPTSPVTNAVGADNSGGGGSSGGKGNLSRATHAWRRAMQEIGTQSQLRTYCSSSSALGSAARWSSSAAAPVWGEGAQAGVVDPLLADYERLKQEEAGLVSDVGKLLGGAGSREAYLRGIREATSPRRRHGGGGFYGHDRAEQQEQERQEEDASHDTADGQRHRDGKDKDAVCADGDGCDPTFGQPLVRLQYLDCHFQLASKVIRGWDARANCTYTDVAEPTIQTLPDADDIITASTATNPCGPEASAHSPGWGPNTAPGGESLRAARPVRPQLEQLYGPDLGTVIAGQVAGELPEAALRRAAGLGGGGSSGAVATGDQAAAPPFVLRRAGTALAGKGPLGADVLVVALDALRRGHEAVRDDLVSERLAVLTSLEPLRGLSDEHQAQLALGGKVMALDANQLIVRQGQPVDALYIIMEGEVRLLDEPMEGLAAVSSSSAAVTAAAVGAVLGTGMAANGGASGTASFIASRSTSLNSGLFGRKAAAPAGSETAAAVASVTPPSPGGGTGGHDHLRIRRTLASLAALTLLGPGGSIGENVLGYPEDYVAAAAAAAATASVAVTDEAPNRNEAVGDATRAGDIGRRTSSSNGDSSNNSDDEAGGDANISMVGSVSGSPGFALGASAYVHSRTVYDLAIGKRRTSGDERGPGSWAASNQFLASAVTSRPSRLLVLPRSLLLKYGYLRSSLPPFAQLRREAINGRRKQLRAGVQNLPGVALGLMQQLPGPAQRSPPPPGLPTGGGSGRGGRLLVRSPSMPPPRTALAAAPVPAVAAGLLPVEVLEQMVPWGYGDLNSSRTAAVLGGLDLVPWTGAAAAAAAAAEPATPDCVSAMATGRLGGAAVGGGGGGGGGESGTGGASAPTLALAERLKRLGPRSGQTSGRWQFSNEADESAPAEANPRQHSAAPAEAARTTPPPPLDHVVPDAPGCAADGAASGQDAPALMAATAGGGGGSSSLSGGDALRAPPKPCVMRTPLTGTLMQYGGTAVRQQGDVRVGTSGTALVPTPSTGAATAGIAAAATGAAATGGGGNVSGSSGGNGGADPLQTRLLGVKSPNVLRTDEAAEAGVDAVAAAGAEPQRSSDAALSQMSTLPPQQSGPAAAGDQSHTPTSSSPSSLAAWLLAAGGGDVSGNTLDSPQAFLASLAATGGGGGGGPTSAATISAPLRGVLLPRGSGSSFRMRTSLTGVSNNNSGGGGGGSSNSSSFNAHSSHQVETQWDRMRESAPGAPLLPTPHQQQPQYPHQSTAQTPSQPSVVNSHNTALSGGGWPSSQGASFRSRLGGYGGSRARTTSQLEIAIGNTSIDAFAAPTQTAAPAAAASPPLPRAVAFGGGRSISSRHAWREFPEMLRCRSNLDTAAARSASGGGAGGVADAARGGSTAAVTVLALAALAATKPLESHHLQIP
ncbi:hypothetical protein VOLCADRAFT_117968, partial [Volvox carteri f. nagariensis]